MAYVEYPAAPEKYAYQIILWELFEQSDDFFLLHAGVVSKNDQAIIIAGYPGTGKTTLVLALLKSGFTFYSDEICPIHKITGKIHPFLRTPWVKTDAYDRQLNGNGLQDMLRKNKIPFELKLSSNAGRLKPLSPGILICIDPVCIDSGRQNNGLGNEICVCLKPEANDQFDVALTRLKSRLTHPDRLSAERVTDVYPYWKITYPPEDDMTGTIDGLLDKFRKNIWNVYRMNTLQPDFTGIPAIKKISTDAAALFVLNEIKFGSPLTSAKHHVNHMPGKFFMQLCERLAGMNCYRLTTGRLDIMLSHIQQLIHCKRSQGTASALFPGTSVLSSPK
jgi:hypothetical protein